MAKSKSSKGSAAVKSRLSLPTPEPAPPLPLTMDDPLPPQSAEGSQDRESSYDIVPTPVLTPETPSIP
ncbi:hypothetical protein FRC00_014619, partial [Tulasnella sp. 408]